MKLLLLAVLASAILGAADVCPPGKAYDAGGEPGTLLWRSFQTEIRHGKFCVANQIHVGTQASVEVVWPAAGIEHASIQGELEVAQCCFDGAAPAKSALRYDTKSVDAVVHQASEEGLENHEEGYPDLIEEDARVRTASVRGTLFAGGKPLQVNIQLKCTASRFAKQYAYQYSITDRSKGGPLTIDWDLLEAMRRFAKPSIQPVPSGKTLLFLTDIAPQEAEGRITIRNPSGTPAAVIRLPGFVVLQKAR